MSLRAAIATLVGAVEGPGITCVVVDLEKLDLSPAHAALAAKASAGKRMLFRATDAAWTEILAAHEGAPPPEWIACEPLVERGSAIGALVVTGAPGSDIDTIVLLPRLASGCATLLTGTRFSRRASTLVHAMNNQLATVMVNIELALDVASKQPDAKENEELLRSLGYTRQASRNLKTQIAELSLLVPRDEP